MYGASTSEGQKSRVTPGRELRASTDHVPWAGLAVDAVRRAILQGVFRSGDRLVEQDLADRLDVSKTPAVRR